MSTQPDLEALRELLAKSTPGPWAVNDCRGTGGGDECWQEEPHQDVYRPETPTARYGTQVVDIDGGDPDTQANVALIVAAVNALPGLLDELDRLRTVRDGGISERVTAALKEAIDRLQLYPTHDETCPVPKWRPDSLTFPICRCSQAKLVGRLLAALGSAERDEPGEAESVPGEGETVYVVVHEESDYDWHDKAIRGIYASRADAEALTVRPLTPSGRPSRAWDAHGPDCCTVEDWDLE